MSHASIMSYLHAIIIFTCFHQVYCKCSTTCDKMVEGELRDLCECVHVRVYTSCRVLSCVCTPKYWAAVLGTNMYMYECAERTRLSMYILHQINSHTQ